MLNLIQVVGNGVGLTANEVLKQFSASEVLRQLPIEEIMTYLQKNAQNNSQDE